jgi:hypothetical protein
LPDHADDHHGGHLQNVADDRPLCQIFHSAAPGTVGRRIERSVRSLVTVE